MTAREMLNRIRKLLDDSKTGVLSTADENGYPAMRWMTPILLDEYPDALYSVTSPGSAKHLQLLGDTRVCWLLQGRTLNEIIRVKGRVNIVDNPSLKASVMESLGSRLTVFWKVNQNTDTVVLETVIEEAELLIPLKQQRETVSFLGGLQKRY